MGNFINKIQNNRFVLSVFMLSSGTAIGQGILMLATPVLTRIYVPGDFGIFAVFTSLLSITVVASSLRYELAIPLPKSRRDSNYLVIFALVINVFVAIIALVIVAFFRAEIARWMKTPALADYLWLLPVGIICSGAFKIFNFWAISNKTYNNIAKAKIIQNLISTILQISAGFTSIGALGLIIGRLSGQIAGVLKLAKGVDLHSIYIKPRLSFLRINALVKKYKNFPKYDVLASIIDAMNVYLPQVLLAILFGPVVAGYFLLVERVLAMPVSLVGQSVGQVFYGDCREGIESHRLGNSTKRVIRTLFFLIVLPVIIVFFGSSSLFPLIFGSVWLKAGIFAKWMVFGAATQFIYSPISMVLMATEGQKLNLCIHISLLACKISGGIVGYILHSPLLTVKFFSFSTMLVYGFSLYLIFLRARRYDHINAT